MEADGKPAWLDVALEEYKALRAEIIETQKAQQWSVGLGLTAIGIVASQVPDLLRNPLAATSVFLILVPLVVTALLLVWLSQVGGMFRLGLHLCRLESAVAKAWSSKPDEVFGWETFLGERGSRRGWIRLYERGYYGIVGLLTAIAAGSMILGWYRATHLRSGETIGPFAGDVLGLDRLTLVTVVTALVLAVTAVFGLVELALARNATSGSR